MRRAKGRSLVLDPTACDAFGYCAELLPELIGLDEWGFPVVADGTVAPELEAAARQAVAACPRRALVLASRVAVDERVAPPRGARRAPRWSGPGERPRALGADVR